MAKKEEIMVGGRNESKNSVISIKMIGIYANFIFFVRLLIVHLCQVVNLMG